MNSDHTDLLVIARQIASALFKEHGRVAASDVRVEFERAGYKWEELGNRAGSIFQKPLWHVLGSRPSQSVAAHGRPENIWGK